MFEFFLLLFATWLAYQFCRLIRYIPAVLGVLIALPVAPFMAAYKSIKEGNVAIGIILYFVLFLLCSLFVVWIILASSC